MASSYRRKNRLDPIFHHDPEPKQPRRQITVPFLEVLRKTVHPIWSCHHLRIRTVVEEKVYPPWS